MLAEISIFSAIVVVLQIIATFINFGSFPITLTLIPIIVAGCVYGISAATILGLVFGIIVDIMILLGADPSGATLFSIHPFIILFACLLKGALAGLLSSLTFKLINKTNTRLAIYLSSIVCPIVNTFTLYVFLILFFDSSIKALIGAFVSINFLIELILNILISPFLVNLIIRNRNRYGQKG